MKNPCNNSGWKQPGMNGSPIGKGKKVEKEVKSIFGGKGTTKKFITGK